MIYSYMNKLCLVKSELRVISPVNLHESQRVPDVSALRRFGPSRFGPIFFGRFGPHWTFWPIILDVSAQVVSAPRRFGLILGAKFSRQLVSNW